MPEICFHSFEETPGDGWKKDLAALVDAVRFVRRVNARIPGQFVNEIQPGSEITDGSPEMEHWIKTQAWGHHACGTCPISMQTLKAGVERIIMDRAPGVTAVVDDRLVDEEPFA